MLICLPYYILFNIKIKNIKKTQENLLFKIIKNNKNTLFGTNNNFNLIKSINDFKNVVPLSTYESYENYIEKIKSGKHNILTKEKIAHLIPTSGSTSASKSIPLCKTLVADFQKGIRPWIFNLYMTYKKLLFGKIYWSITPNLQQNNKSNSKVKINFNGDNEYFNLFEKLILNYLISVPEEISKVEDIESFRYITLLFLINCKNLRLISVWNPMFLSLLFNNLEKMFPKLINDLENSTITPPKIISSNIKYKLQKKLKFNKTRIFELKQILFELNNDKTINIIQKIWPKLTLVSCWADGNSSDFIKNINCLFPQAITQPKGLLATEGIISVPMNKENGTRLSINSHFFEFIELNNRKNFQQTKLAHELEKNKRYSIVLTTNAGFYRYQLKDIIEVVGFSKKCPLIYFIGKDDNISDYFGEKLNENHIKNIFSELFQNYKIEPEFAMLAPEEDANNKHFYTLFLQMNNLNFFQFENLIKDFEEKLLENYHYKYCRKLEQLLPVKIFLITNNADSIYLKTCKENGQKLGNIKPRKLDNKKGWNKKFPGRFLEFIKDYNNI